MLPNILLLIKIDSNSFVSLFVLLHFVSLFDSNVKDLLYIILGKCYSLLMVNFWTRNWSPNAANLLLLLVVVVVVVRGRRSLKKP